MDAETLKKLYEPKPTDKDVEYERQLFQARFSPCGKFLLACGYDATIQRWKVAGDEFKPLAPISGHNGWVQSMEFDPRGDRVFSGDSWGGLACWQYAEPSPKPVWKLPEAHCGWIRAVAVSPDGQWVATGGNDTVVKIWNTADGTLHKELPHPVRVFSLCFHPAGKSLVSGDLEGKIRDWDVESEKVGRHIDASVLYLHDVEHDKIQHCGGARHLAFNADGSLLVCAGQKSPQGGFATGLPCAIVFDWASGEQLREMQVGGTQDGFAYDARFHPDGFVMATSCAFPGKGHLWFWRPEDEQAFYISNKIPNGRSLSLHPDGRRLAMTVSLSPNGNGRQLKDGNYVGGTAKIRMLEFPARDA